MYRLIEIFYLLGLPLSLGVGASVFLLKNRIRKTYLLSASALIFSLWSISVFRLADRASKMSIKSHFGSPNEIVSKLGAPETILDYTEGDSEWGYSVRVWPWNTGIDFGIYKQYIIGYSTCEGVGLLHKRTAKARSEKEAKIVRDVLTNEYGADHFSPNK